MEYNYKWRGMWEERVMLSESKSGMVDEALLGNPCPDTFFPLVLAFLWHLILGPAFLKFYILIMMMMKELNKSHGFLHSDLIKALLFHNEFPSLLTL